MNDKRKNPRKEGKKSLSDRIVIQAVERMLNKLIKQEENK